MRQMSPVTNLLLACLGALGLLGTLTLPWFAPPVDDATAFDGPVERTAKTVGHVFRSHDGAVTGQDAAGGAVTMFLVLAGVIVVLAALALAPAMRPHVRDLLRAVAIATPLLTVAVAVRSPGTEATLNLHWGLLAALAVAFFTASAAWQGGEIRQKRAPAGSWARPSADRG